MKNFHEAFSEGDNKCVGNVVGFLARDSDLWFMAYSLAGYLIGDGLTNEGRALTEYTTSHRAQSTTAQVQLPVCLYWPFATARMRRWYDSVYDLKMPNGETFFEAMSNRHSMPFTIHPELAAQIAAIERVPQLSRAVAHIVPPVWKRGQSGNPPVPQDEYPASFKVKLEASGTERLDRLYDFLFDKLNCSWVGSHGHYAYDEDPTVVAKQQDGYLYVFKHNGLRVVTADRSYGNGSFIEVMESYGNYVVPGQKEHGPFADW